MIVQRKGLVSSSYFFAQLLPSLGIIISIDILIKTLADHDYLENEGLFEGKSGLNETISIADTGRQFLIDNPIQDQRDTYVKNFGESELLTLLLS